MSAANQPDRLRHRCGPTADVVFAEVHLLAGKGGAFGVTVNPVNDPPVAVADAAEVYEDGTTLNLWEHRLGNDTENDPLTIQSVDTTGTLGTVQFDAASDSIVFIADDDALDALAPGDSLETTFTYTVADGNGGTAGLSRLVGEL